MSRTSDSSSVSGSEASEIDEDAISAESGEGASSDAASNPAPAPAPAPDESDLARKYGIQPWMMQEIKKRERYYFLSKQDASLNDYRKEVLFSTHWQDLQKPKLVAPTYVDQPVQTGLSDLVENYPLRWNVFADNDYAGSNPESKAGKFKAWVERTKRDDQSHPIDFSTLEIPQKEKYLNEYAAVKSTAISALFRGRAVRKTLSALKQERDKRENAAITLQAGVRGWLVRHKYAKLKENAQLNPASPEVPVAPPLGNPDGNGLGGLPPSGLDRRRSSTSSGGGPGSGNLPLEQPHETHLRNEAAKKIQSLFRGVRVRQAAAKIKADKEREDAKLAAEQANLAKTAFDKIKNEADWPRRLTRNSYAKEIADTHKLRAIVADDGTITFKKVKNPLQNKSITQIAGSTIGFSESRANGGVAEKLLNLHDQDDKSVHGDDYINYQKYGFSRANYYGESGLSCLQHDVEAASRHYGKERLGEDEFHISYARVHSVPSTNPSAGTNQSLLAKNDYLDLVIIATSTGVTQVFADKGIVDDRASIAKEFYDKHGEAMMLKALEEVGAFKIPGAPVAGSTNATPEYERAYKEKTAEAIKLVRALTREHVMGVVKKEVMAAQAVQKAQGLSKDDYESIGKHYKVFSGKKTARVLDEKPTLSFSNSLNAFKDAKSDLQDVPDPVSGYKGVAYSRGERDGVIKVSFTSKDIDIAYPYIPNTPNCHVRMRVATSDGTMDRYHNGKLISPREFFKKGEIVMDIDTIYHFDGTSYVRYGVNNKFVGKTKFEEKFPNDTSAIRANLKDMLIQGVSDIDGSRGVVIKGRGVSIAKQLAPSVALDVNGNPITFTKKLPNAPAVVGIGQISNPADCWDPKEIFVKCPELDLDKRTDVDKTVLEARKNVIIKMRVADHSGMFKMNNGKEVYLEEGAVFTDPTPYYSDGNGGYAVHGDSKNQLGEDFLLALSAVQANPVVIDEYKQIERALRNAIRDSNVKEVNEILTKYELLFKWGVLDINAVEDISCKSALHLAVENSSMWKMDANAIKTDSVIDKLLMFGADPSQRCSEVGALKVKGKTLDPVGLTAAELASKRGASSSLVVALGEREKEKRLAKVSKLIEATGEAIVKIKEIKATQIDALLELANGEENFTNDERNIIKSEVKRVVDKLDDKPINSALQELQKRNDALKVQKKAVKQDLEKLVNFEREVDVAYKKLIEALKKQFKEVVKKGKGVEDGLEGVRASSSDTSLPNPTVHAKKAESLKEMMLKSGEIVGLVAAAVGGAIKR